MIQVKRLNGSPVIINAQLIETVEAGPDTVISLVTGNRFVVQDSVDEIVKKVLEYYKQVYSAKASVNPVEGYIKKK